jgi:hypothetical protein
VVRGTQEALAVKNATATVPVIMSAVEEMAKLLLTDRRWRPRHGKPPTLGYLVRAIYRLKAGNPHLFR